MQNRQMYVDSHKRFLSNVKVLNCQATLAMCKGHKYRCKDIKEVDNTINPVHLLLGWFGGKLCLGSNWLL